MLDWINTALGAMMRFFNNITGSYALALLFYALVFKIVFLPFTIKQQKNQIKMAKLTPKIELIKAKYKGRTDQPTMQKQQQEIMELQQKEGYNPMSGCLPLLIQMPIILLLYTTITGPLAYVAKPTDTFKAYNDSYTAVETLSNTEYAELLDRYGITDKDDLKEITRQDVVLALYKEFGSYTSANGKNTKDKVIANYESTLAKKNARKAYKNVLKAEEIALLGNIRAYVDNGYSTPSDIAELLEKQNSGEEMSESELARIEAEEARKARLSAYTTEEQRAAYVESFGIAYKSVPNFMLWGVNLADTPSLKNFSILCIIPVLAAIAQWFTMWIMRKVNPSPAGAGQDAQTAASMKMMDLVMPAMTLFIAFNFSGMLGLYWVYQSILGLLNSLILAKLMPIPKFSEEELKEMRRQQKEVEKAARTAAKQGPKYRSLHYIDDDDYEELPPLPKDKRDEDSDRKFGGDMPEIKD